MDNPIVFNGIDAPNHHVAHVVLIHVPPKKPYLIIIEIAVLVLSVDYVDHTDRLLWCDFLGSELVDGDCSVYSLEVANGELVVSLVL